MFFFRIPLVSISLVLFIFLRFNSEVIAQASPDPNSWEEVRKSKEGVMTVYWFESRPFIFKNDQHHLEGIEYDLINGFTAFVHKTYNVKLNIRWVEATSFSNILEEVQGSKQSCFGASAFSITESRKVFTDFSPPYMADIMVMISSKNVPIIEDAEQFYQTLSRLSAVSIKGTTYEQRLLALQEKMDNPFRIEYIPSSLNILKTVEEKENSFGFIDLPVYLMYFSANPSINVKRQNFFPAKSIGYGIPVSKGSDWVSPLTEYFDQPTFHDWLEKSISKYIDIQLFRFVESLTQEPNRNIELLTKEKEIQREDILNKALQIRDKTRVNYILTSLVAISVTFLIAIIYLYRKRKQQKDKIEMQQKNIEFKNQQLEQRNQHLVALNDEKNNLIKILAHDMRAPLNQVQGLSQILLLENPTFPEDQKMIVSQIRECSLRLGKMISNILDVDAIEGNRINFLLEDIAISPLVEKVIVSFQLAAETKNIIIRYIDHPARLKIRVDSLYLTQVLENLLSNAIKFSERGKTVEVSIGLVQTKVQISIEDHGPGLTEKDQANLFKKFQRLSPRPTNGEPSIGLGLSIVKQYVELMGGQVWCDSSPGSGATFTVSFEQSA